MSNSAFSVLLFGEARPFGLSPTVLGLGFLTLGVALITHARFRQQNPTRRTDWWMNSPFFKWLFTGRTSLMSIRFIPLPAWASEKPDVFLEYFYGFAFIAAGFGGIFFFPE
jgi:hypothetical protein